MKFYYKKNKENIWFAVAVLVSIISYRVFCITDTVLIGIIGSIATIYLSVIKLKVDGDNLFNELFKTFNERYDQRFNDLINKQRIESKALEKEDKIVIIDYFNLCAEEYLWFTKKRIPEDVWYAWKIGIDRNLEILEINKLWHQEMKGDGAKSYYRITDAIKAQEMDTL
ncbi:hypothetical protein AAFN85_29825 [Mucilaginibacter sp. CAU 1740]|uniref:hypothetical protein n=1 Tax=Mucilaginibacter sp. CAU 1740 TaxID=3140365 RepID=UPI00325BB106